MIKIGDIFEIPLKDSKKTYGQYIYKDIKQGPIIQVFDLIINEDIPLNISDLIFAKPLFPPIITGLQAAIRVGLWHVIGKMDVKNFTYPKFVSAYYNEKTGEAYKWFVWDGEKYDQIGSKLPNELKNLEYLIVWSPYDVIYRIETGHYPFPYGDLIMNNKFIPLK